MPLHAGFRNIVPAEPVQDLFEPWRPDGPDQGFHPGVVEVFPTDGNLVPFVPDR
jgi:hypothetical protein